MAEDWKAEILDFWFGELSPEQWFDSTPELDQTMRERFGALHERIASALPVEAQEDARAALAAIIALDQFPRNMFRGTAQAFASDNQAVALARNAVARGLDADLAPEERQFLYMPLMHSEVVADQEHCVSLFADLENSEGLRYAEEHRDIVARFGRFPHRNKPLDRESTPEERDFLKGHAGYGQ